ncbi:MAG: POTRA domain-containing protein [Thermoguttaceae bacterium]
MADLRTDTGRPAFLGGICLLLTVIVGGMAAGALAQMRPEPVGMMPPGAASPSNVSPNAAEQVARTPAAGAPDGRQEQVVDVRLVGNKTIPTAKIMPQIHTRRGRQFDVEQLDEDVRRLHKTGMFVNVRTYWQQVPGGRIVIFDLIERPLLQAVIFFGNTEFHQRVLRKEAGIKVGDPANPSAAEEARAKLEEYYHKHGYEDVRVRLREGTKPEDRRVIFEFDEGVKVKVLSTTFVGNQIADDGRLRTQIGTSRPFLYLFSGELDLKKVDEDVEKLVAYYRALGFFRARIGREIEYNKKQSWATVTFAIDEGPRYKVRNVSVLGNTKYTSDELTADLQLKNGQFFNQGMMAADQNMLQDKYGGVGYVFADVKAEPRFLEEPAQLDLVYSIREGDRYRVGKINVLIKGDYPHTQLTTVLNRLSLKPGDILDTREIRASERRLRASGLFESNPANGNPPKITMRPPGEELLDDGQGSKGGSGRGGRRGLGRGTGGPGSVGSDPTFRGQSPDVEPQDRVIDITLDCGQYIGPKEDSSAATNSHRELQTPAASYQNPSVYRAPAPAYGQPRPQYLAPGDDAQPGQPAPRNLAPGDDRTEPRCPASSDVIEAAKRLRDAAARLPQRPRHGVIETQQYSPDAGRTNPASQPTAQWTPIGASSRTQPAANYGGGPSLGSPANGTTTQSGSGAQPYAAGQAGSVPPSNNGYAGGTQAPPAAPVQSSPAYGQQLAPTQAPQRAIDSPEGPYLPGPIFSENSPFRDGAPDGGETADPLTIRIAAQEAMTGRLMFGVGVNSDAGLVGQIVMDEQNFDPFRFPTSWDQVRNGTAWRGGGKRLRIEAVPGTQLQRYMIDYQDPFLFDTQVSMGLSGYFYNRQYTEYLEQRIGGRVSLGYQFAPDLSGTIAYRGAKVNITDPVDPFLPDLIEVTGRDLALHGLSASLAHDTRDNAFLATEGHLMQASVEQVLGSFSYPHAELDLRKYFTLCQRPDGSGRQVLTLSARAGVTGDNTPIYERYYAGGFSTIRGFQFRDASPHVYSLYAGRDIFVGGDFELFASAEYMFPITADDMIRGVVFCDTGTVEPTINNWTDRYRVAPGFGLRICVPAMGPAPIALDFAFPVSWQPGDRFEVFSFFVGFGR